MKKIAFVIFFLSLLNIPVSTSADVSSPPTIIRPFGDSITFGYSDNFSATTINCYNSQVWCFYPNVKYDGYYGGGYRGVLTWFAINNGNRIVKPFSTVGNQSGGSSLRQWLSLSQFHDGYPGARTDQVVPYSLLAVPPAPPFPVPKIPVIALVHIGTNDFVQGYKDSGTVDRAINNLSTIIANLSKHATKIYLAKIIGVVKPKASCRIGTRPCPNFFPANQSINAYNQKIVENFSKNNNVTIVDMSNLLLADDYSADGVHPELSGYFKMSCLWAEKANLFISGKTCKDINVGELTSLKPLAQAP